MGVALVGVYQYLIMQIYCPSKPGDMDCGRILEDIWACGDVCTKVVNGS